MARESLPRSLDDEAQDISQEPWIDQKSHLMAAVSCSCLIGIPLIAPTHQSAWDCVLIARLNPCGWIDGWTSGWKSVSRRLKDEEVLVTIWGALMRWV